MTLLISNCDAMVVSADGLPRVLTGVDIGIDGATITSISPTGSAAGEPTAETIDGTGLLAVPGLANAHCHSPMVLMRGAAEDVSLERWFNELIWPMEMNLTPDRVYAGARLACAEMLLAGVTAFADHYFAADRIADAAAELGIRANIAPTYFSTLGADGRAAAIAAAVRLRDHPSSLIGGSLGPHATYTVDEDDLAYFAAAGRAEGLQVHIHTSETIEQTRASQTKLGVTPIEVLARTGILETGALIAHGTGIVEEDLPVLAGFADRVGVACCPKGYFKSALDPMTPVRGLREHGIRVGIGTDGAASGNTMDVWEQTRLMAMAMKRQEHDAEYLTVAEAIGIATRGGASLAPFGLSGTLEPGAAADVVLVDLSGPHCQPVHDALAALLYSMRGSDVRTVVVNGRVVVRDRTLVTADLGEILREARSVAPQLLTRRPGEAVAHYAP